MYGEHDEDTGIYCRRMIAFESRGFGLPRALGRWQGHERNFPRTKLPTIAEEVHERE
jgi:hypothetical protein